MKTLKCDLCEVTADGETFEDWMTALRPHYMEAPGKIVEPYEPNVTALLNPEKLKWRHLVESGTPVPTPWPKDAYEEHSLAYQERRTAMREENVAESEMNKLFSDNQNIVEKMFADAPYSTVVGADVMNDPKQGKEEMEKWMADNRVRFDAA